MPITFNCIPSLNSSVSKKISHWKYSHRPDRGTTMRFSAVLSIPFLIISFQALSFAFPTTTGHHHHHHHEGNRHHEKKSKTPPTNEASSAEKILEKVSQKFGLGLSANAPSFPNIFSAGKIAELPENVTTKTKTTTKVDGPFTTVTKITKEFETDKNNKTHLIGQTVQSVTTTTNSTAENGTFTHSPKKRPAGIFAMDFEPFGFSLFAEEPERECGENNPCKAKGTYCDLNGWQCKPLVKPGKKCYQPGQCDSGKDRKHACVWGTCTLTTKTGDSGTFCKKDSDCASDDMRCAAQEDVSEFSNICISKPDEGETCGRRSIFDFIFVRQSLPSSPCKNGFACMEVGNLGRKICRPESLLKDEEI